MASSSSSSSSSAVTGVLAAIVAMMMMSLVVMMAFLAQDEEDQASIGALDCMPGSRATGQTQGNLLAAPGSFIKPVDPAQVTFTSGFGERWGSMHKGIDLAGPIGTPIYAAADGTVNAAGNASGFGQWVVLDHVIDGKTISTVYGHIDTFTVAAGQPVRAGQLIATIGNRGQSTGPHLHFEIWDGGHAGGQAIDPLAQYEAAPAPGQAPAAPSPAPAAPSAPAAPVDQLAGATPVGGGDLSTPTPASMGSEANSQVGTKRLMRALAMKFGDRLDSLGGWRANGGAATDHPEGRAVDAMIPNYSSGEGVALGNEVLDYVMANADFFHLEYAIWRQTIHFPGQEPSLMEDRGSDNENHMNHVHITVDASGFDDTGTVWGQLPGRGAGSNAAATSPGCTVAGGGLGEDLADGSVPPEFEPWIRKAGGICPQIKPSLLASQLDAENGFAYGANAPVSSTGAGGPAQFMPGTWASYGKDYDGDGRVDVNSIGDAVMAQGQYMCDIAKAIDAGIADGRVAAPNGPTELYLAGYNAGEGAVLSSGGFPTGSTDYVVQTRPYADKIIAGEAKYRKQNS